MKTGQELIAEARSRIEETTVDELARARDEDSELMVLDVREGNEVEQGTIPGATCIPRGFLELKIEQVHADRERPIVVYCAGGVRSALAAETLARMGYSRARSLVGGFRAWTMSGQPVERR